MKNRWTTEAGEPAESASWIWREEGFVEERAVPISDRGFRYGMSVFESFPVRKGVASFLPLHLARLREACSRTGLHAPDKALEQVAETLANGPDGFGRIYVTAGDGSVKDRLDEGRLLLMVESRAATPLAAYFNGYRVGDGGNQAQAIHPGLKTGNYWMQLQVLRAGLERNLDEMLLFTPAGQLVSACMANVFVAMDGALRTPGLESGARAGVVRQWVMARTPVVEVTLNRTHLLAADEMFLTSSWLGIMPVADFAGKRLPARWISSGLRAEYRDAMET